MQQFGLIRAIYMSFYSRELYCDVVKNWGANVCWYLLVVLLLAWLPAVIQGQITLHESVPMLTQHYVTQLPVMDLDKEGHLNTPENRPYLIKEFETNKVIGVIDTSGKYMNLDHPHIAFLATKTEVITRDGQDGVRMHQYPEGPYHLTPEMITTKIQHWAPWIPAVILPFVLFFSFVFRMVVAAVYALIGLIINALLQTGLSYPSIFQIAIVSFTPTLLLNALVALLAPDVDYLKIMFLILSLGYLLFGIHSTKGMSRTP